MLTATCPVCGERIAGLLDYENHRRGHEAEPREIRDRELDEIREDYAAAYLSPFVRNAQAGRLPAKEYAR